MASLKKDLAQISNLDFLAVSLWNLRAPFNQEVK